MRRACPSGANFVELRLGEVLRIPILRGWVNKGRKRGLGLLGAPAHRSRIGYFRLASLLRLGQLVPDSVLDPPRDSLLLFLGGGLLAVPGSLVQLVPDVVLDPPEPTRCSSSLIVLSFVVLGLTAPLLSTHIVGGISKPLLSEQNWL